MKTRLLSRLFAPLVAVGVLATSTTQAQVLLEENFTFTGLITNNGWTGFSGTTNFISADVPKLTFPNLPSSGVGNSAGITNTGQDAYKLLASNNSTGDIYTSFLINVSTAGTGDYFYSLYSTNSSGGGYFTRVFTQTNSTGFSFGVSRAQSTNSLVSYETNVRSFNTTYLVVAKMSRAVGTSNDVVSLWVDPLLGGAETSPLLTNNSGADNTNSIAAVAFRQGTTTPGARLGNILVGTTWASVTPSSASGGPSITSFTPTTGAAGTAVTITGSNFTGATAVTFNGVAATIFTVNSPTQITATVPVGATTGPIAVTTPVGFNASADNFVVPAATVTLPAQVNEGATATGTVTLTSAAGSDVVVSLVSSSPSDLVVPASVTVATGNTSVDFEIQAPLDSTVDSDVVVTVTPTATGYVGIAGTITVKNIDISTAPITSGGYAESFSGFTSAETLPLGWSIQGSLITYGGDWGTGTTGGTRGNASVFGYQHTGSTGVVQQILTLRNETGADITDLTVSYTGRMAVAANGRTPSYTVTVQGTSVPALAYSTASGDGVVCSASLSGLTIAPNQVFQIIWSSDGSTTGSPGSGSRRQIGISSVSVSPTAALLPPSVTSLAVPLGTVSENSADVSANVTADGGSAITARGFVYSLTSVNADPAIGGTGVTNVVDPLTELGAMNATLTGLAPSTEYSIKAYATNAQGTTYTTVQTFTTLAPAASFTGSYFNAFNNFTGPASLPGEWTATSSTGVQNYIGAWTSGSSSGGFYGGVSSPGVLGYTHTSSTGTLTVTLRLVNDTGAPITDLNVRYLGRVEQTSNTRFPTWTVTVGGVTSPELAYTTEVGVDETKTAAITGLNIPEGETFSLTWVCDRGLPTGSSRRIGMANVVVSTSEIADPVISVVGTLTAFSATEGNPSAAQTVSASGSSLNGDIVVTAPANYEVSTDGTTYASSVTLTATGGSVPSTTVYVRIAATAPLGNPAGLVTFASDGATSQTVAVTGTVSAAGGYDAWAASYSLSGADALPAADPDKDGYNNNSEYAFGTVPNVANRTLVTVTQSAGNALMTWIERDSGFSYAVQSTTNLSTAAFADDGTVTPSTSGDQAGVPSGYTRKQATVPASNNKFFRVRATPN